MCKGYSQVEGIDFEDIFALVARMEAIGMFLAFAAYKYFKFYQMDVKFSFLNEELEEEVCMEQLEGFQLSNQPNIVCRLKKELYGLKQDPRAWYEKLYRYVIQQGFNKGTIDSNLYFKVEKKNIDNSCVYW